MSEEVFARDDEFGNLTIVSPDGRTYAYDHSDFLNRVDPGKRYVFYDSYYGFLESGSVIDGPGEGSALILSNSYGYGIAPYIAENYSETAFLTSLHPANFNPDERLADMLNEGNVNDVYLIANPAVLSEFTLCCPDYFAV